jgi:hypothetical protein
MGVRWRNCACDGRRGRGTDGIGSSGDTERGDYGAGRSGTSWLVDDRGRLDWQTGGKSTGKRVADRTIGVVVVTGERQGHG